ncbi:hypothetical protein Tco_1308842 [Tanacetum coccineum]
MQSWGRSSYVRAMIELWADVEFQRSCLCLNLLGKGSIRDECPENIGSDVVKNLKNPSQASRGVPVGPKNLKYHKRLPSPLLPSSLDSSLEDSSDFIDLEVSPDPTQTK